MMQKELNKKTRSEYIEWLKSLQTRYFLTLSYSYNTYERIAVNMLNNLFKMLNRKILRNRYNKHGQYIQGVVVMENTPKMNTVHFHILIIDPKNELPPLDDLQQIIDKKIENVNRAEKKENQITDFDLQEYYSDEDNTLLEKRLTKIIESCSLEQDEKINRFCPLGREGCSFGP